MAVFKPDQVLISPVSSYYQGKAIRAQQDAAEQNQELRGLQIDIAKDDLKSAPSKREAAREAALLNRDNIQGQIDARERAGEIAELQLSAQALTPLLEDYAKEEDEDLALANFNKNIGSVTSILSEKEQQRIAEAMGPDKRFSHEEVMTTGLGVRMFNDKDDGVTPTSRQRELGDLLKRGIISQTEHDELILSANTKESGGESLTTRQKELGDLRDRGIITPEEHDALILEANTENDPAVAKREREIADLIPMLDGDRDLAVKIVDKLVKMSQNPVTGMIEYTDTVTGEAWEVPVTGREVETARPEAGRTLFDLSEFATGPQSAIIAGASIPLSWVGLPVGTRTARARQTFSTTNQNFIRALSINPRFPVGEQERIREEISMASAILDSPELMQQRMIALNDDMTLRMNQAEADGNDVSLPIDLREMQKSNAREIRNYLAILCVPERPSTEEEYDALPSGTRYLHPDGDVRTKK